jgi:L-amino acid N-acyltransferase YncA
VILRPARPDDAVAICGILNPIIAETTITFTTDLRTPDDVAERISQAPETWRVAETRHLLGFACFGPFRSGPGYVRTAEHSIHLSPAARGQGIGRALMAALEEAARARGHSILVGAISAENAAARGFHTRVGFTETGYMPGLGLKFGRVLDLVLVQKDIAAGPSDAAMP